MYRSEKAYTFEVFLQSSDWKIYQLTTEKKIFLLWRIWLNLCGILSRKTYVHTLERNPILVRWHFLSSHFKIQTPDKGGGIIILDSNTYHEKIELLGDPDTYEKIQEHNVNTKTQRFNKFIRKSVTCEDKSGEIDKLPPNYIQSFQPTQDTQTRYSSVPYIWDKQHTWQISPNFTPAPQIIISVHIKNYSDLINRLKSLGVTNKNIPSLHIKSIFTNMPITKCLRFLEKIF